MGSKSTDWYEDEHGKSHYWTTQEAARLREERDEMRAQEWAAAYKAKKKAEHRAARP